MAAFDNIHNYYEVLVLRRLDDMLEASFIESEQEFLEDVACVALNHLPTVVYLQRKFSERRISC